MNKIFFFCLMASLVSLRASDEGGSSPLMMEMPRRGGGNQGSNRDDKRGLIQQQGQQAEEHQREATDGRTTPPNQERNNASSCTTRETVATSSPSDIKSNDLILEKIQNNLSDADQEIKEALERYDSISAHCSTYIDTRKHEALKALSAALSAALNPATSSSSNELEQEVLSKITAAKEACEIEDSEEVTPMANNEVLLEEQEDKESNLQQQLLQSAKKLEDCRRIKNKILSDIVPYNHYDPLHPIVLINNTLTDGIQFPLILPRAFPTMKFDDCVRAGLAANIVSSLAASPYLQAQLFARSPRCSHAAIRSVDAVTRTLVDIPYVFYYVPGWYALKLGTASRITFGFILPSALARKATWRFVQSKAYRGSLEQRAEAFTSHDPRMTPIQWAFKDALERFGPDIVAATTRSFFSNLYDYHQGTISAEEVFTKTAYSAGVYTIATLGFYSFYRILEAVIIRTQMRAAGSYQDFARADLQKAQVFKKTLSALKLSSSNGLSLLESLSESDRVTSTIQHVTDGRVDSLSHTLKFLDSPVTNLMSDPFYRWSFGNDPNAIESFRVLDALKFLRTMLPSLKSADTLEKQQAYAALTTLKSYLIPNANRGDIESGGDMRFMAQSSRAMLTRFSTVVNDPIPQNKIDALIEFFEKFSTPPTRPESLLGAARYPTYHAVDQNEDAENGKL